MNIEIERKFTVNKIPDNITNSIRIEQFYMLIDDNFVQRLRLFDDKEAIISLKQNCSGLKSMSLNIQYQYLMQKKL